MSTSMHRVRPTSAVALMVASVALAFTPLSPGAPLQRSINDVATSTVAALICPNEYMIDGTGKCAAASSVAA